MVDAGRMGGRDATWRPDAQGMELQYNGWAIDPINAPFNHDISVTVHLFTWISLARGCCLPAFWRQIFWASYWMGGQLRQLESSVVSIVNSIIIEGFIDCDVMITWKRPDWWQLTCNLSAELLQIQTRRMGFHFLMPAWRLFNLTWYFQSDTNSESKFRAQSALA